MPTTTDSEWSSRLASILGANFASNWSGSFAQVQNQVVPGLMEKIGKMICSGADMPTNPFSDYTKEMMDVGSVLSLVKQKYVAPDDYDPEDTNPFALAKPDAVETFYSQNDSVQYCTTVWDRELRRAFQTRADFDIFVANQLDSLSKSDILDKRTKWKKLLTDTTAISNAVETVAVDAQGNLTNPGELLDIFRNYANDKFLEPSTSYNVAGDTAITPEGGVDIIMRRRDKIAIDKVLAGVYNLEKIGIDARVKLVDDFATTSNSDTVLAVITDRRALAYYPTQVTASTQYNAKGLYSNNFLTVEGVYAVDRTRNALRVLAS